MLPLSSTSSHLRGCDQHPRRTSPPSAAGFSWTITPPTSARRDGGRLRPCRRRPSTRSKASMRAAMPYAAWADHPSEHLKPRRSLLPKPRTCMASGGGLEVRDAASVHLPAAGSRSGSPVPARLAAGAVSMLHSARLGTRPCSGHGRSAGTGQAHRQRLPADDGACQGEGLLKLPSDPQPCAMEFPRSGAAPADHGRQPPRAGWPGGHRDGREHRASVGAQVHCAPHLSRSCPLQSRPVHQGQRAALVKFHGADAVPVGGRRKGPADLHPACPITPLRRPAGPQAQAADRPGPLGGAPDLPLVARPRHRLRRRQQFRRP